MTIQSGMIFNQQFYDLDVVEREEDGLREKLKAKGSTQHYQVYSSLKWEPTQHLVFTGGLHSLIFGFNKNFTVEPRLAFRWAPSNKHILSIGTGLYSQLENMATYLAQSSDSLGNVYRLNQNLDIIKSVHNVVSYIYQPVEIFDLTVEGYYQFLYHVAIASDTSNGDSRIYSSLNERSLIDKGQLVAEGNAYNYGLDVSASLITPNRWLAKFNISLYDSKYTSADDRTRRSRWSQNVSSNVILGKEFLLGDARNGSLRLGGNLVMTGGRRFPVIDEAASIAAGTRIYDEKLSYKEKGDMYYRLDVMLSYTLTKPKFDWNIRLDVQNVTNNTTLLKEDFDEVTDVVQDIRGQVFPIISTSFNFEWKRRPEAELKIKD
ncbi:MAG: hypothetical protein GY751_21325 [Bacteroidetes bacterium]|nr:hypothetical protein [Bacteroidota bacterium]